MLRRTRCISFIINSRPSPSVQLTSQRPSFFSSHISSKNSSFSPRNSFTRSATTTAFKVPSQFSAPNIKPFHLADVGEGIAEVEILQWFVKEGDFVKEFDKICEVQSDKATLEITSRYEGEILRLEYQKSETAKVGTPLLYIRLNSAGHHEPIPAAPSPVQSMPPAVLANISPEVDQTSNFREKVLAAPAVRRIARELGIDLSKIVGTGKQGRVTKEDILAFQNTSVITVGALETHEQPVFQQTPTTQHIPVTQSSESEERREPVRGIQKAMIKTMTAATSVPHFGYHEDFNMDSITKLRDELKPLATKNGVKVTYLPLLIKMASIALSSFPIVNSSLSGDLTEIVYKRNHNIGIAVDSPQGLIVPNIKRVQDLSILDIAKELNRLQKLAVEGKLGTEDLTGGTFTISNIGSIGGTYASPILMPGEVVICALGKIRLSPRFTADGAVRGERILPVSFSGDHRIIDGATIANFSNLWKSLVENPSSMFLYAK